MISNNPRYYSSISSRSLFQGLRISSTNFHTPLPVTSPTNFQQSSPTNFSLPLVRLLIKALLKIVVTHIRVFILEGIYQKGLKTNRF